MILVDYNVSLQDPFYKRRNLDSSLYRILPSEVRVRTKVSTQSRVRQGRGTSQDHPGEPPRSTRSRWKDPLGLSGVVIQYVRSRVFGAYDLCRTDVPPSRLFTITLYPGDHRCTSLNPKEGTVTLGTTLVGRVSVGTDVPLIIFD